MLSSKSSFHYFSLRSMGPLSYKVGGAAVPFPSRGASAKVFREAVTFTTTLGYVCGVFLSNIGCLVKLLNLQSYN